MSNQWPPPEAVPERSAWAPPQPVSQPQPPAASWPPPQQPAPFQPQAWPAPQGAPGAYQPYGSAAWAAAPQQEPQRDRAVEWLIPINRSAAAIAAGYVGLVSIVVFILGPVAILLGILALRDIRRRPGAAGTGRAWFGIVTGGLASVALVVAIGLGVLQAIR